VSLYREQLEKAVGQYILNTFDCIDTVKGFCEGICKWMTARKIELRKINNKSQDNLAAVLKDTMSGMEELDVFLDAVEKLAVTSRHVFMENQVIRLPEEIRPEQVQVVIIAARLICPLLLEFKRDPSAFFLPRLQNVEVLSYQLDKYIQTTQKICEIIEKSHVRDLCLKMKETLVSLDGDLSEDDTKRMLCHINRLAEIRMDQNFRMVFLFHDVSCSGFIDEFSKRQPRMLQFLNDLEDSAVHLDRMNMGAKISNVAGSSVGVVGGALSIIGLVLIPFTAGGSLGLTFGGLGLGVASGANSIVTAATEMGVNRTQQSRAKEVFQSFMEDVQSVQDYLEKAITQIVTKIEGKELDVFLKLNNASLELGSVGNVIKSLLDEMSAAKALESEDVLMGKELEMVLHNTGAVAQGIGGLLETVAVKSLNASKLTRISGTVVNALFIGLDIFDICKESISLSKGSETEVSQFIRARSALWSTEIDSWQNIHDCLHEGLPTSEEKRAVLESSFYPGREIQKKQK
ncbi:Apolipoprotein L3, partial [Nibea albiflora]